jgi:hypothetical protein
LAQLGFASNLESLSSSLLGRVQTVLKGGDNGIDILLAVGVRDAVVKEVTRTQPDLALHNLLLEGPVALWIGGTHATVVGDRLVGEEDPKLAAEFFQSGGNAAILGQPVETLA